MTPELRTPGGPLRVAGKMAAVFRITLSSQLTYGGEVLVRCVFLGLVLFIFTALWRATAATQDVPGLTGFGVAELVWYLVFTEALVLAAPSPYDPTMDREVRNGEVAYRLARPLPYPLFHLGADLGERVPRFALNLLFGSAVAWVMVGPIRFSVVSLGGALVAAALAFVVDWAAGLAVSMGAFWFENTQGLHLLYRRVLQILGGMLIPIEAYPDWLAEVCRWLPFQYLLYRPARLFVGGDPADLAGIAAGLLVWLTVAIAALTLLYRLGLRRVTAQGG